MLALTLNDKALTGQMDLYVSSVIDTNKREIILKLVNTSEVTKVVQINIELPKHIILKEKVEGVLLNGEIGIENTLSNPYAIKPRNIVLRVFDNKLNTKLEAQTFYVYKLFY